MIYILLAGLTGSCLLICAAGLIVRVWDRLDPEESDHEA